MTFLPFPFAIMNTRMAFRLGNSVCGGGRMTCLPLPFACNSVINTLKAFRLCYSLCRGGRVTCPPWRSPAIQLLIHLRHSASATDFAEEAASPVYQCRSPNTHMAFASTTHFAEKAA